MSPRAEMTRDPLILCICHDSVSSRREHSFESSKRLRNRTNQERLLNGLVQEAYFVTALLNGLYSTNSYNIHVTTNDVTEGLIGPYQIRTMP